MDNLALPRAAWTTIMASLYSEATRARLPAGMKPEQTDEWKLAVAIENQLAAEGTPARRWSALHDAAKVVIGGNWYALVDGGLISGPVLVNGALSLEDYSGVEGPSEQAYRAWVMLTACDTPTEASFGALVIAVRELTNQLLTLRLERDQRGERWGNTRTNEISAALLQAKIALKHAGAPAGFLEGL